jgi:hypothetical protein
VRPAARSLAVGALEAGDTTAASTTGVAVGNLVASFCRTCSKVKRGITGSISNRRSATAPTRGAASTRRRSAATSEAMVAMARSAWWRRFPLLRGRSSLTLPNRLRCARHAAAGSTRAGASSTPPRYSRQRTDVWAINVGAGAAGPCEPTQRRAVDPRRRSCASRRSHAAHRPVNGVSADTTIAASSPVSWPRGRRLPPSRCFSLPALTSRRCHAYGARRRVKHCGTNVPALVL